MRHPIVLLSAVVFACAGLDSAQARAGLWYRDAEGALFLHSVALWTGYAALGLPLIALASRLLQRWRPEAPAGARWAASTAAVLVTPVLVHARLDPYFGLGGDLGALLAPGPLASVVAAGAIGLAVAALILLAARSLPALTLVGLLAAGAAGAAHDPTPAEPAPSPTVEAPADAPNILLLVWDTTRAASLDLYGRERATAPALARLGGEALVYETARSTSVFTLTSHLSMLTGTYPSHHGARLTRQIYDPERTPSIARTLRDAGYRTAGFVGTSVLRGDTGVCDGFEVYDDRVDPDVTRTRLWSMIHDAQSMLAGLVPALGGNGRPHWFETFDAPADGVLPKALEWIQEDDPRPWFCFVNLYDVHWPYLPSQESRERLVAPYDGAIDGYLFRSDSYVQQGEPKGAALTAADDAHLVDLYEAELLDLDADV
ncbi:MAG: sulfatase-like hydrolase/transferase, partial [Planctomycetota bacterium]|nr:sulfatase-like hydrolase/transferase [Planctomycetota bacterium]